MSQTQEQILSILTEAEKTLHPRFAKDEHNATVIREWIQKNAQGYWSVANFTAALRSLNNAGQIHWLSDPNPAPPPPPEPRQPSAADIAAAKQAKRDAFLAARKAEEAEAQQKSFQEGHKAKHVPEGWFSHEGTRKTVLDQTYTPEEAARIQAETRDRDYREIHGISAPKEKPLDLNTTTNADLKKASPEQVRSYLKRRADDEKAAALKATVAARK
jgi:hypothetical protein